MNRTAGSEIGKTGRPEGRYKCSEGQRLHKTESNEPTIERALIEG